MHRLVGQGPEFGAQGGDHPAGQIEVATLGGAEVLLDGDHLLLGDEAVPAAQGLGVVGRIGVIGRHVLAHDRRGVAGDIKPGEEAVLQSHAGDGLAIDPVPGAALGLDELAQLGGLFGVGHHGNPWSFNKNGRPRRRSISASRARRTVYGRSPNVSGAISHLRTPTKWTCCHNPT